MELPYDRSVYSVLIDGYNRDYLAVVITGALLCISGVVAAVVPKISRMIAVKRSVLAGLALCSVFVGGLHQMNMMADLNFMAPVYGALWIANGALMIWLAFSGRATDLFDAPPVRRFSGLAISAFGLILYPALVAISMDASGFSVEVPGTAPDPTVLVIAGLVLTMREPPPLVMLVLPLVWAGVAGLTAYLLSFQVVYAVTAVLLSMVMYSLYARFSRHS